MQQHHTAVAIISSAESSRLNLRQINGGKIDAIPKTKTCQPHERLQMAKCIETDICSNLGRKRRKTPGEVLRHDCLMEISPCWTPHTTGWPLDPYILLPLTRLESICKRARATEAATLAAARRRTRSKQSVDGMSTSVSSTAIPRNYAAARTAGIGGRCRSSEMSVEQRARSGCGCCCCCRCRRR
jgi:hypothetical protein